MQGWLGLIKNKLHEDESFIKLIFYFHLKALFLGHWTHMEEVTLRVILLRHQMGLEDFLVLPT